MRSSVSSEIESAIITRHRKMTLRILETRRKQVEVRTKQYANRTRRIEVQTRQVRTHIAGHRIASGSVKSLLKQLEFSTRQRKTRSEEVDIRSLSQVWSSGHVQPLGPLLESEPDCSRRQRRRQMSSQASRALQRLLPASGDSCPLEFDLHIQRHTMVGKVFDMFQVSLGQGSSQPYSDDRQEASTFLDALSRGI